ncbi:aminodeoxychorismate lyase [Pseudoalteromonas denitrificans]|uniref:Aminodeoxychorismate lyase n=1 Tax=Pseudoalteromonas denitrificans DSM 6059 TaxID=1123010 RepID=A0A1I1Q697_9GAMM|nr:aminodeoxychorismate lyase [Pseudoalteromonas denitrificans]SFD17569.1 4-amino-4-deoxychorismate lyase [Pseudoalteromonas denitrificans DSM 6059]
MTKIKNHYTRILNNSPEQSIALNDRGLNYGDGFFTTAKVVNGQVVHWNFHKLRLIECQQRLGFPEFNFQDLECAIINFCSDQDLAVLKILITRGSGGRGYAQPLQQKPIQVLTLMPYPDNYQNLQLSGLELEISQIKLGLQPLLAGMKTLNRMEQVLIKQDIVKNQCHDALVLDLNNNVIETSIANVVCYAKGQWLTPKLDLAGIKGVYREYLMSKIHFDEVNISVSEFKNMDAVFCCNSLMGLVPIKSVQEASFDLELASQIKKDMMSNTKH